MELYGKKVGKVGLAGAALLSAAFVWPSAASADDSIRSDTRTVNVGARSVSVHMVTVDLKDPYLTVEPVAANGGIGTVQSFAGMMAEHGAAAGVNGTFFDAYEPDSTRRFPNGMLIAGGTVMHSGDNVAFLLSADKAASIARLQTRTDVTVTRGSSEYRFRPWGVNAYYGQSSDDQIVLFTSAYGRTVDFPGGVKAVVENGKVTALTEQPVEVPDGGTVIFIGLSANNRKHLLPNVHVGDRAAVRTSLVTADGSAAEETERVLASVGAGPRLVAGGAVDVDFARDGFDDPKLTTAAGARSFIGVDGSGRLAIGTVPSATITELAQAAAALGLVEAMNLDGGASSGLYANGDLITKPGRELSNALAVIRHDRPQVQIEVNGAFVNEFRGFIDNGTTLAPFRGIFERLNIPFEWNGDERTLTVRHRGTEVVFRPDSATTRVDGKAVKLDAPARIVDGHMYVPLRFIAETFGAKVGWDAALYRAYVDL